ncbi:ATP-binding cassette domain-containing protein [Nocardioides sp.]|uniref:ATP-binding cassette domain-containing protein n=1 Tax=Nocardioides sp. TaxID=35761 RepID=UPI003D0F360D
MSELGAARVSVSYGEVHALHDVSLQLVPGQFVSITGPSGAGKTSLLWALAGALAPDSGTVHLGETQVTGRAQAAGLGISLVPQGNGLATSLTAHENIVVPLLAAGTAPGDADQRTRDALVLVGLEDSGRHLVEELSGGQQQRVALARALAAGSTVLLADEPTSDLDAANRERMLTALRAEATRGAIVVMSTHDPEAADFADGELALHEGHLTWARRPA